MSAKFYNYPRVLEGPFVAYKNEPGKVPVLSGVTLNLAASLVDSFSFLQSLLWKDAGLNSFRLLKDLRKYSPRYDPTVTPINSASATASELPIPVQSKGNGQSSFYTSADYHALYSSGALTPLEVAQTLLPLVRRDTNPAGEHSTAFLETHVDAVLAAAQASTERYKSGTPLGPLDGVPVAVKDEVHLKGYKRTVGTKLDFKNGIDETSWCVKKWEEAGAVIIGKTTMHECGCDTTNNNSNYGTPRNPHNPAFYCGGSSGGSGYAISAGLVPIALGADGGGSIRIPGSYCGLWGLKPSHGRISAAPTVGLAQTTGVYGPMAATVDDLALSYRLMAASAPAEEDPVSSHFPDPLVSISAASERKKRIGLVRPWIDRADPAVRKVFDLALEYYRDRQGYEVIDIDIPYIADGQKAHALVILAELSSGIDAADRKHLLPHTRLLMAVSGNQSTSGDLIAAQRLRSLLMSHLAYLFTTYPDLVIFTPTVPMPGWRIRSDDDLVYGVSDGNTSVRSMEYVYLANFTGCPAINCPAGYDPTTNMPIGVMGMGEWGSEEALIAFARDGEGILHKATANQSSSQAYDEQEATADTGPVSETAVGARIPHGLGSQWVDVIEETKQRKDQNGPVTSQ